MAESQGFKQAARRGLVVQVGDVARVNFAMEVGAVTETCGVSPKGTGGLQVGTMTVAASPKAGPFDFDSWPLIWR